MTRPARERFRPRNLPIRQKLLLITLLVAVVISGVSLACFQYVTASTNRMVYAQTAGSMAVVADKIAARLDSVMDESLYIAVNRGFQDDLAYLNKEAPTQSEYNVVRSQITTLLYSTFQSDLKTITVLPLNASPISLVADPFAGDPGLRQRAQQLAAEARGAPVWLSAGNHDSSVLCVREIRNVSRPFLEPMGLLVFRVDLDRIVRESAAGILSGDYHISVSQNGEQLFPGAANGQPAFGDTAFADGARYAIAGKNGEQWFVVLSTVNAFRLSWDLVLGIPYGDVFRSLMLANVLFAVALVGAVVLSMLLSHSMLNSISQNVQLLAAKMDQVRTGNVEPYVSDLRLTGDELGTLNRHFDEMTAEFKQVLEDNYVKQLLLTQTQLKALEQQINPHFLYNTLESINWFAWRGDGENVSAIAQALGRLLRSTLTEEEDRIPLERELAVLDSYLQIQRIRFPDTLRVHTRVDEDARAAQVPKMSIQPLVENAIVHALEENIGECHIYIRVFRREEMVWVEVENDGSEIDPDILDKLREKRVQPKGHGIGLMNIDSRLKLLFGPEYGLKLECHENRVIVSFCIPAAPAGERPAPDAAARPN